MKNDVRDPNHETVAVRVPLELARRLRRAARQDDRTLSGYLRRVLNAAVGTEIDHADQQANTAR